MHNIPKISVIIPTLNEENGIRRTIESIPETVKEYSEIIVVDGLSEDNTVQEVLKTSAKIVFENRKGKGIAMRTGARLAKGEILIFIDGDGTYPSEDISKMVELLDNHNLIIGNAIPFLSKIESKEEKIRFHWIGFRLSKFLFSKIGVNIEDPLSGMRAIRKKDFESLNLRSDGFEIETEMNLKAWGNGFKIKEVPISIKKRDDSKSKFIYDLGSQFRILKLTLSHSQKFKNRSQKVGIQLKKPKSRYSDLVKTYLKSRFLTQRPFFFAHSVTFACNSKCKTCTQWQMSKMIDKDLKTDEVISLLDQAYDAGMRGYYAFGGEPLLRRDIIEILDYSKEKGYVNIINTNCSSLEKKADLISENTDFIFASLDYPDAYHDVIRGRKGSFNEVMNGINEIMNIGKTRVLIVSTISKLNFNKIEEMALLAQKLGIGISYNAVEPTFSSSYSEERTYSPVEDVGLDEKELKHFYKKLLSLKQKGYPLMESEGVLNDYTRGKPFKCHFPKIFVYVSPDGKIFPCSDYGHTPINLKETSFEEYFLSKEYKEHVKNSETCKICIRTCVRMYSYTYVLKPLHLISLIRTSYKWVTK